MGEVAESVGNSFLTIAISAVVRNIPEKTVPSQNNLF